MLTRTAPLQPSLWGGGEVEVGRVELQVRHLDSDSLIVHVPGWLRGADVAFGQLEAEVPWRAHRRPMYDRIVDVPRLTAAVDPASLGDAGAHDAPAITRIIAAVRAEIGAPLEHIGLNLYRDGADSVAWHRDRIGDRRDWSVIALVSLGGPRSLQLRRFAGTRRASAPGAERAVSYTLHSGDLLVMAGACQRDWEHRVPKTRRAAPRISIACRTRQFPQGPLFQHPGVTPWCVNHKLQ